MRVIDANQGRFPSERIGNEYGALWKEVELSAEEVYAAIARAAVEKGLGRATIWTEKPGYYSVSATPGALARFVVLGRGVRARLWDGYAEVALEILPEGK